MSLPEGIGLSPLPVVPEVPMVLTLVRGFQIQDQDRDFWCWAAVVASIAQFYGDSVVKQCAVVAQTLKKNNVMGVDNQAIVSCCPKQLHSNCEVAFLTDFALKEVGHFAKLEQRPLDFGEIMDEIPPSVPDQPEPLRRPIACSIRKTNEPGAHAVTISGWAVMEDGERRVYVNNPNGATSSFESYEELKTRAEGRWELTYLTAPNS